MAQASLLRTVTGREARRWSQLPHAHCTEGNSQQTALTENARKRIPMCACCSRAREGAHTTAMWGSHQRVRVLCAHLRRLHKYASAGRRLGAGRRPGAGRRSWSSERLRRRATLDHCERRGTRSLPVGMRSLVTTVPPERPGIAEGKKLPKVAEKLLARKLPPGETGERRRRGQSCRKVAEDMAKSCSGTRVSAQTRPKLVDSGQMLVNVGRLWPEFDQNRQMFVDCSKL